MKESTRKADTAVIGGGAAALALVAMLGSADVTVLERNTRAGKKLLATGNGKCNLTGEDISADGYNRPDVAGRFLNDFPPSAAVEFFNSLGLATRVVNGRVYPYSECASSVLDVLLAAVRDSGAAILTGREVSAVERTAEGFCSPQTCSATTERCFRRKNQSSPHCTCKRFLRFVGQGQPVVVQGAGAFLPPVFSLSRASENGQGKRQRAERRACKMHRNACGSPHGRGDTFPRLRSERHSGAGPFGIVCARHGAPRGRRIPRLCPRRHGKELTDLIAAQRGRTCERVLRGMFHSKVAERIMARAGQAPDRAPDAERIASVAKDYRLTLQGTADASAAQVMSGGLDPDEFDADLQSLLCRGAYAMGEALDVDGICGGYNLQWAWMSAHAVARGLKNLR